MATICIANPKGGTGKTTTCLLLAEQMAMAGYKTEVMDCDPNHNILAWSERRSSRKDITPFSVIRGPDEDNLIEAVEESQRHNDITLLDMEGTASQVVTFAISQSDLCLIPFEPTPMETRQAARAVSLVKRTSKMISRDVKFSLIMTRTNAAFQTNDERDVRASLTNIPILASSLVKRAAYTRIFRDANMLQELGASGLANLDNAEKNAKAVARDVIALLSGTSK